MAHHAVIKRLGLNNGRMIFTKDFAVCVTLRTRSYGQSCSRNRTGTDDGCDNSANEFSDHEALLNRIREIGPQSETAFSTCGPFGEV